MVLLTTNEFKKKHSENEIDEINKLISITFNYDTINPIIQIFDNNEYLGYLIKNNQIVSCGFGKEDIFNPKYKYKTIYIHTFATKENYKGKGLCTQLVNEFITKFGKTHIIYLTVRTESNNINESAIRCYEKCGFIMLPKVYRDHYDG